MCREPRRHPVTVEHHGHRTIGRDRFVLGSIPAKRIRNGRGDLSAMPMPRTTGAAIKINAALKRPVNRLFGCSVLQFAGSWFRSISDDCSTKRERGQRLAGA